MDRPSQDAANLETIRDPKEERCPKNLMLECGTGIASRDETNVHRSFDQTFGEIVWTALAVGNAAHRLFKAGRGRPTGVSRNPRRERAEIPLTVFIPLQRSCSVRANRCDYHSKTAAGCSRWLFFIPKQELFQCRIV